MSLHEIDRWIGKTLFVPPIIKLCQVTRQSQYALSRLFWFAAALDAFYRSATLFTAIVWGILSVIMMLTASLRAETPTSNPGWVRGLAFLSLAIDLMEGAATGKWVGIEFWLLVLIAEYAGTIRNVPPLERKRAVSTRKVGP